MARPTTSTWLALAALALATWLALAFGDWWWPAVIAFAYGLWRGQIGPGWRFWPAFAIGFGVWFLGSLWYGSGAGSLPAMLGNLLGVGSASALHLVQGLVGGLLVGTFAMLGAYTLAVVSPGRGRAAPR